MSKTKKRTRALRRRERRAIGATRPKLLRMLRAMRKEDPDGFAAMSPKELVTEVQARLIDNAPQAIFETYAAERDWAAFLEALIAFLEKFIPILLKIIGMF